MAGVAFVIGARNLHGEIARHLSSRGDEVAAAARSEETIEALSERLPDALGTALDATDPAALEHVA